MQYLNSSIDGGIYFRFKYAKKGMNIYIENNELTYVSAIYVFH